MMEASTTLAGKRVQVKISETLVTLLLNPLKAHSHYCIFCDRRLCFCREIENFLSLHWHSPLRKTQTAASSVNETLKLRSFSFFNSTNLTMTAQPLSDVLAFEAATSVVRNCRLGRGTEDDLPGHGREPWSSGYGRRLMFQRSWVQILAPYINLMDISHIYLL